jgi:hypothetical protein
MRGCKNMVFLSVLFTGCAHVYFGDFQATDSHGAERPFVVTWTRSARLWGTDPRPPSVELIACPLVKDGALQDSNLVHVWYDSAYACRRTKSGFDASLDSGTCGRIYNADKVMKGKDSSLRFSFWCSDPAPTLDGTTRAYLQAKPDTVTVAMRSKRGNQIQGCAMPVAKP